MGLFGAVDIGQGAYWWDYGQLKLYFANNIRVTEVRASKGENDADLFGGWERRGLDGMLVLACAMHARRVIVVWIEHRPHHHHHPHHPNQPQPNSPPNPQNDAESALYRAFLGVPSTRRTATALSPAVTVDAASVLSAVGIGEGSVAGSVLTNVVAPLVEADGAVLVNVTARRVKAAKGAVVYNVVDDSEVRCEARSIWCPVGWVWGSREEVDDHF
jgi:hypothetical protein